MDAFSLILGEKVQQIRREKAEERRRIHTVENFLRDPKKLDTVVSTLTSQLSTSTVKPKFSRFNTKTEAYDSQFPDDHPLKGFGPEFAKNLKSIMSDPRARAMDPVDVANVLSNEMLASPGRSGAPRIYEAYEYKRRSDAAFFDDKVAAPPGYEAWLKGRRVAEQPKEMIKFYEKRAAETKDPEQKQKYLEAAEAIEEGYNPTPTVKGAATWAGLNMALTAAGIALSPASGGLSIPAALSIAAALGIGTEIVGKPWSKAAKTTEWYNALAGPLTATKGMTKPSISERLIGAGAGAAAGRKILGTPGMIIGGVAGGTVGVSDTGKALLAEMLPYVGADITLSKAAFNTFVVPRAAAKVFAAAPDAASAIEMGATLAKSRQALKGTTYIEKLVNRLTQPSEKILGINPEVKNAFTEIANSITGRSKIRRAVGKKLMAYVNEGGQDYSRILANYHGPKTDKEFVRRANEALGTIFDDEVALGEAISHPDGLLVGAIEVAARSKSAAFMSEEGSAKIYDTVTREIQQASKLAESNAKAAAQRVANFQSKVKFAEESAAVEDTARIQVVTQKARAARVRYESVHPEDPINWRDMETDLLRGAPGGTISTPIVVSGQAKIVDAISPFTGKTSRKTYEAISKAMNSYEARPIKDVFVWTARPTQIEKLIPTAKANVKAGRMRAEATEAIVKGKKSKQVNVRKLVSDEEKDMLLSPVKEEKVPKPDVERDEWDDLLDQIEASIEPIEYTGEIPEPIKVKVAKKGEDGKILYDKKGEPKTEIKYVIETEEGRKVFNTNTDSVYFSSAKDAKAEFKQFMAQSSPAEAKIDRITEPVGTIERSGKSFTEVIETDDGLERISYAATKTADTKEARAIAVDKAKSLAKTKKAEKQFFKEVKEAKKLEPYGSAEERINELAGLYKDGAIGIEEFYRKTKIIVDTITENAATKFADVESAGAWARPYDEALINMYKIINTKAFMAAFGVPAVLYSYFSGGEAEASPWVEAALKGVEKLKSIPKGTLKVLEEYRAARYIVPTVTDEAKFLLGVDEFQQGMRGTTKGGASVVLRNIEKWSAPAYRGRLKIRHKLMSPGALFEESTTVGEDIMSSPAPFKVSFQNAEYHNNININRVIDNIIRDSNIKPAANEIRKPFGKLNPMMMDQIEYEYRNEMIRNLKSEIKRYSSGAKKNLDPTVRADIIAKAEEDLVEHQAALDQMPDDAVKRFHNSYDKVAEEQARLHPSVKITLAIGDNAKFEKYPFLKNIHWTREEKIAVGRGKEKLLVYKQRLKDIGQDVIEGDYVPHVFHPDFDASRFNKMTNSPEQAAAYMRIYRRSFNSRPLMPDFEYTFRKYTGDIERRIHAIDFWKKEGWEEVMYKTQHIPVLKHAFDLLREGMNPMENTIANKIAQKYVEFEAVHKLFLSPSATSKHLIKFTADVAQRGFKETLEATPLAIQMTSRRIAEANPMVAKKLSGLGITGRNEQAKLLQDYFSSQVPAYGIRRYLLDLGIAPADEMFTQARGIWGKVQDVSGAGINLAELTDRGLSMVLGQQIAGKRGLTIEQALYGTLDMVLKNNFLSREFNPGWLNNPAVRAMAMFQATPFKIFERRVVNFIRSGRVTKDIGKQAFDLLKADIKNGNTENARMLLKQIRDIRSTVKLGEQSMKANIFVDAALKETDFFGSPIVNQFARDVFIIAGATYGFGQAGMNVAHHFFHIPFTRQGTLLPSPSFNPAIQAIDRGITAWERREEGDDEFLTTKIYQKWLGKGWLGLLPTPVQKLHRITEDDIPTIYQDSPLKYMFAVPTTREARKKSNK